jgi:TPR repeat protein
MALLLAHLRRHGIGVPKDLDSACALTRPVAEMGCMVAAANLGDMLLHGEGTPQDFDEAVVWLRRALPLGATRTRMGHWYARESRPDLVSQAEALENLIIAFHRGDPWARHVIDEWVDEGRYTVDDRRLLTRGDDPDSWATIGLRLLYGPVRDRDETECLAAVRQAARGRDEETAPLLETLYRKGGCGLPRDEAAADKWALAARRFRGERVRGAPREDLSRRRPPGSPAGWLAWETKPGLAGQAGQLEKPQKPEKAKKLSMGLASPDQCHTQPRRL